MSEFYVVAKTREIAGYEGVWEEKLVGPIAAPTAEQAVQSVERQLKVPKENIIRVYFEQHY
jgi:hypothetical protein